MVRIRDTRQVPEKGGFSGPGEIGEFPKVYVWAGFRAARIPRNGAGPEFRGGRHAAGGRDRKPAPDRPKSRFPENPVTPGGRGPGICP